MNQKSTVVYSTHISQNIYQSFSHYNHVRDQYGPYSIQARAAFVSFANTCEAEHRNPVVTAGNLINQKYQ